MKNAVIDLTFTSESLDVSSASVRISISNQPDQTVPIGTAQVTFPNLSAGSYTYSIETLDVNGNPCANNSQAYPAVIGSFLVDQLLGDVVTSATITLQ